MNEQAKTRTIEQLEEISMQFLYGPNSPFPIDSPKPTIEQLTPLFVAAIQLSSEAVAKLGAAFVGEQGIGCERASQMLNKLALQLENKASHCEICYKTAPLPPNGDGATLHRVNPLGVKGVWRCPEHLATAQLSMLDRETVNIVNIITNQ